LIGYETDLKNQKIFGEVLEEENLKIEDFRVDEIPWLTMKGSFRNAYGKVKVNEIKIEKDEFYNGKNKLIVDFNLEKGNYANVFLENFFDLKREYYKPDL